MPLSDHILVTSKQSGRSLTISRRWGHRVSIFGYKTDIPSYLGSECRGLSQPSKRCGRRHPHTIAFSKRRLRVGMRKYPPPNGIQVNLNVMKSSVKQFPARALRVSKRKSSFVERKRPHIPGPQPGANKLNLVKIKTVRLILFYSVMLCYSVIRLTIPLIGNLPHAVSHPPCTKCIARGSKCIKRGVLLAHQCQSCYELHQKCSLVPPAISAVASTRMRKRWRKAISLNKERGDSSDSGEEEQ
jgi:hypothetical protein